MAVTAELKGNRIWIRSKSRPLRALDQVIPGAGFSKNGGPHWSVPLTLTTLRMLKKKYRDELVLTPQLDEWRRAKVAFEKRLAELARQDSAELGPTKHLFPALFRAMQNRWWQPVGARFIAEGRRVLVGDTVGLGKTIQALGGIIESEVAGPYLVIAPKTAASVVWGPEISRWLPGHVVAVMPESRTMRNKYLNRAMVTPKKPVLWVIIHPWMLHTKTFWQCNQCKSLTLIKKRKKKLLVCEHNPKKTRTIYEHEFPQLFEIEWGAIIIDESHKVLIKKHFEPTQTRSGADLLQSVADGIRIAQSASPFNSNPPWLWGTLNWILKKEHTSYWNWVRPYWEVEKGFNDSLKIGELRYPKRLAKDLRGIFLRRTREEVAPHLPRRQYMGTPHPTDRPDIDKPPVGIWLPMEGKQKKIYSQMIELSVAHLKSGSLDAIGSLAELTRLRQFATAYADVDGGKWRPRLPSNKLEYILDVLLPELNYDDEPETKVVVVSQFTQVLELFASEVDRAYGSGTSCLLTGKVTSKRRPRVVEKFNRAGHPPYVMFLHTIVGGESITLDAADEMVFVDERHDADVQDQAEGRIDNRRPEEKIVQRRYRYLRSLGTVDEEIALAAAERGFESQKVLRDGERFARKILGVS